MTSSLRGRRLRSSPLVEMKTLAELPAAQREPFLELERDPDFHALLVPRPPLAMNLKAVGRETAALFHALRDASTLEHAPAADGDDVIDLILDGILEVENGDGFVSGADALPLVCPPAAEPPIHDAAARLSRDALLYAQDLETSDPVQLTSALYFYNRVPLSPFWSARFAGREAVLESVGAGRGTLRALLERDWELAPRSRGWASWSPKTTLPRNAAGVTYKLYVSPRPERIRDAFEVVVRVLAEFPGTPFKIGDSAAGLLRPDKLVAYFPTRELLDDAAAALRRELAGCEAQGVPFSAGIDERGLLSWGIDPPDRERALRWQPRTSWRFWLAERLGAALSIGKTARTAAAVEPWRFAIARARRHGIDVESWTPSASLWSAA